MYTLLYCIGYYKVHIHSSLVAIPMYIVMSIMFISLSHNRFTNYCLLTIVHIYTYTYSK